MIVGLDTWLADNIWLMITVMTILYVAMVVDNYLWHRGEERKLMEHIINLPEAVKGDEPFTRCKQCKHWHKNELYCMKHDCIASATDYCSFAESKEVTNE